MKTRGHGSGTRLNLLRALAGAASCLPRIGTWHRLNIDAAALIAEHFMDGQPANSIKHHLMRLDGPQWAVSTPTASIPGGRLIQSALSSRMTRRCCLPHLRRHSGASTSGHGPLLCSGSPARPQPAKARYTGKEVRQTGLPRTAKPSAQALTARKARAANPSAFPEGAAAWSPS